MREERVESSQTSKADELSHHLRETNQCREPWHFGYYPTGSSADRGSGVESEGGDQVAQPFLCELVQP